MNQPQSTSFKMRTLPLFIAKPKETKTFDGKKRAQHSHGQAHLDSQHWPPPFPLTPATLFGAPKSRMWDDDGVEMMMEMVGPSPPLAVCELLCFCPKGPGPTHSIIPQQQGPRRRIRCHHTFQPPFFPRRRGLMVGRLPEMLGRRFHAFLPLFGNFTSSNHILTYWIEERIMRTGESKAWKHMCHKVTFYHLSR